MISLFLPPSQTKENKTLGLVLLFNKRLQLFYNTPSGLDYGLLEEILPGKVECLEYFLTGSHRKNTSRFKKQTQKTFIILIE